MYIIEERMIYTILGYRIINIKNVVTRILGDFTNGFVDVSFWLLKNEITPKQTILI